MANWHGYILLEKTDDLNQANFDTLCNAFRAVAPVEPIQPAHLMHTRVNLGSSAEFFECKFNPADVEVESFKQFMANTFGVDVADVGDEIIEDVSYSELPGVESRRWGFTYPIAGAQRLQVVRFGRGGSYLDSWQECLSYLATNRVDWETVV